MVTDRLENASLYTAIGKRIAAGLNYLLRTDFSRLKPGKYELDGERLYALVQEYSSMPIENNQWEVHKKYADIHFIATGTEWIGCVNAQQLTVIREYDSKDNCSMLSGNGNFIAMHEGAFMVVWPDDAHMPGRVIGESKSVKKVVIKALL